MAWITLRDDIGWGDYICLYAEALDAEEIERYRWFVNSQLDLKYWEWSSPDKAGTEPERPMYEVAQEMSAYFPSYDWETKYQRAKDVSQALGRPLIYMTKDKRYFDEKGGEVVLFDDHGEATELGAKAIVLPVRPNAPEL